LCIEGEHIINGQLAIRSVVHDSVLVDLLSRISLLVP